MSKPLHGRYDVTEGIFVIPPPLSPNRLTGAVEGSLGEIYEALSC